MIKQMIKKRLDKLVLTCGQSTAEYVLLVGIIAAALISMQVYMKRGIQSMIKVAADEMGKQEDAQDIDPQKGTKTSSQIISKTEGTEKLRLFKTGKQEKDLDRFSTSEGTTTYTSEREK